MNIWVDAQLSPALAPWITQQFGVEAVSVRRLGLLEAKDPEIFSAAREASAIVLTKDVDFVILLERLGRPREFYGLPAATRQTRIFGKSSVGHYRNALELLNAGEVLVEISDVAKQ